MTIYYVLIFLMSIFGSLGLYFLFKNNGENNSKILKALSIIVVGVMTVIHLLGETAITPTQGLNMHSPFGDESWKSAVGLLLIWFTYSTIMLIALYPFFKVNNIKNLLKFFGLPTLILDFVFFGVYGVAIAGVDAFKGFNLQVFLMCLQTIIGISYLSAVFIRKDYFKIKKKDLKKMLLSLIPVLLAIMPGYMIQGLFGYAKRSGLTFDDFTFEHRIMLYLSVIIPVTVYYCLKNKRLETKRFAILYFSLGTLWTFISRYTFADLMDPLSWPLHLCHTAMFIVPLCIIFKMDKLFYFTFFINVMGAFLAMILPNTGEDTNIFSTSSIIFWVNHFCAFFMPVLVVALKIFERPKLKQWIYSQVTFVIYFVFILIINAWFSNYGSVDYFYLNSDFIVDKLGKWAENTRNYVVSFNVGNLVLTFYPIYQSLFFAVYMIISLMMWFIYEQLFEIWDLGDDIRKREKEYRRIKREFKFLMKERGKERNMENRKPCLELKEFSKKYGHSQKYAVKDVSFKVNGGEIFGFLGPNGAGKSTIIKSMVGIQTVSGGSIEVCGYDVEKEPVDAKREIGFVPDHYALYENLTGREYINYIADLYEVSKEDRDERIERYVTNFQLESAFDNQMKTYSHGMKQKITIMAALVHNPKVWILDEPLTGLDPTSIFQVKECMKEHAKAGNIVFFSSHIIDVVERICDRIAIIKKGTLMCDVKVKELDAKKINLEDFYLETINGETK